MEQHVESWEQDSIFIPVLSPSVFSIVLFLFFIYNSRQKSWGTVQFLYPAMNFHPLPPLKQRWYLGEVHVIMGKFHVHKCPIDEPTLF